MRTVLMVAAAGEGKRMSSDRKKQYMDLGGMPLLSRTLRSFAGCCELFEKIILIIPPGDESFIESEIISSLPTDLARRIEQVPGGESRRESVYNGLRRALDFSSDYVFIHDGARPFISCSLIRRVLQAVRRKGAVTVGTPVTDTIKIRDEDGLVESTPDRDRLMAVQTPQAFSCELLKRAHEETDHDVKATDDASLVEELGHEVLIVRGSYDNIKITRPRDLKLAEIILEEGGL